MSDSPLVVGVETFLGFLILGIGMLLVILVIPFFLYINHKGDPPSLYYNRADSTTIIQSPSGNQEIVWFDTIPTVCYNSGDEKGWMQVRPVGTMIFSVPDPLFLDDEGCKHVNH